MNIYIDHEYCSHTLADLLVEAQTVAREAWYAQIENEVVYMYRDLAKEDVRSGASVTDHPMFSPSLLIPQPYDIIDDSLVKMWEVRLTNEIAKPTQLGSLFDNAKGGPK